MVRGADVNGGVYRDPDGADVFGVYEFKTAITVTFVIFALNFLTFWWELARWIDSWMMEALYNSDTHSQWNMNGLQNTSDDVIMRTW